MNTLSTKVTLSTKGQSVLTLSEMENKPYFTGRAAAIPEDLQLVPQDMHREHHNFILNFKAQNTSKFNYEVLI